MGWDGMGRMSSASRAVAPCFEEGLHSLCCCFLQPPVPQTCCYCTNRRTCTAAAALQVAVAINALSKGQKNNEMLGSRDAVIADVGQLRRGTPVPEDVIKAGNVRAIVGGA